LRLIWAPEADEDLEDIETFIGLSSRTRALRAVLDIVKRATVLASHPEIGRQGFVSGTRELPLQPLPYTLVYRVLPGTIQILRVLHQRQKWPID